MSKDLRKDEWFLTINDGAKCYNDTLDIVKNMNYVLYGVVLHDKDNEEQPHKHVYIKVKNALTFKSMLNKFEGAHIEVVKYTKKSIQYLVHKNDSNKYPYNPNIIISNDLGQIKSVINEEDNDFEEFNEHKMLEYIVDGTNSNYLFIKRFGPKAWNTYWRCYRELLTMQDMDADLMHDLQVIRSNRTEQQLIDSGVPFETYETGELHNYEKEKN